LSPTKGTSRQASPLPTPAYAGTYAAFPQDRPLPNPPLILASGSEIRLHLLQQAGLTVTAIPARIDEASAKSALLADGAKPRDIADTLAELKARKCALKHPGSLVLGCDQVLALGSAIFDKPTSADDAIAQMARLQGHTHSLFSALVLYDKAEPVWRVVGQAQLTMRALTDDFITAYVARNWHSIQHSVGGYKIEEEGRALFSAIDGDDSTIQGLPLTPLMGYLGQRGFIAP
jgi:septum formation protein